MGFKGEDLIKAIEQNKEYAEFWKNHAFIKD